MPWFFLRLWRFISHLLTYLLTPVVVHDWVLLEATKDDAQAKKIYQKSNKQFVSLVHKQEQLLRGMYSSTVGSLVV